MSSRRKKKGSRAWWYLLLALIVAGGLTWTWWKFIRQQFSDSGGRATNQIAFDITKATNIMRWLETNVVNRQPSPPPATNFVIAPATNAIVQPPATRITNVANIPPPRFTNAVPSRPEETPRRLFGPEEGRPVRDILEAQIALTRMAISSGPVDGVFGSQTRAALRVFQEQQGLQSTGDLDAPTKQALLIIDPVFVTYVITEEDLRRITDVPESWLEKSRMTTLDYESVLELVSEKSQAHTNLIRSLNPRIDWDHVAANTVVTVPYVTRAMPKGKAAFIRIHLAAKTLQAFDASSNLLAHFPCSIAQKVEKRPSGELHVLTGAPNPNYTFNPEVFPESEEARRIARKLTIPPGPNNPVGTAWISLDKPGYGIHGTPLPEKVGRTESHGCFRLANWNAEYLLRLAWPGLPVYVQP